MAFLGHLGPPQPLRPMVQSPWDHQAPFGPNPMGPRGQLISPQGQVGPKTQPTQKWPKDLKTQNWPQFSPWPLATTRGHQLSSKQGFPSSSGEDFPFINEPCTQGSRSGPDYVIPNQVPNPSQIPKEDFSAIQSGNSLVATRRQFEDPNHLVLKELGCQFSSGLL
ncbi:hypothetical protein O181_066705 [Austropuccinia psidii MF-1]|uniref:Uncharacterized protein n=1 Tax=Austropuccinia psidii MF-1 TaxID=1389203 RepID=A0A9Q3I5C9_9BASI|nr:hypothetical protein [Austropuccinia psidii MF-1]